MSLWSDFLTNDDRIIHKWTHYFPIYERHLERFRNQSITLLEIGVSHGGSLQMWKRYFGPFARIVGVDIDPRCAEVAEDQIEVRIGSQGDPAFLAELMREFGPFDIVLDDGSHKMGDIWTSFTTLYPNMTRAGVYLVEDLHTAYWPEYEGGLRQPGSFIERCKALIDELNADHTRGAVPRTGFSKTTLSMHIYDSVVVFERGVHLKKHAPMTGKPRVPQIADLLKPRK